jgi:hypothetical protein
MQFIFTGFTQDMGFRVFAFEGVGLDRIRIKYTVRADLTLLLRYGIPMQELPLLCRRLLERGNVNGEERDAVTFTEDEMRLYVKDSPKKATRRKETSAPQQAAN